MGKDIEDGDLKLKLRDTCQTIRCPLCQFMIAPDDEIVKAGGQWHHKICVRLHPLVCKWLKTFHILASGLIVSTLFQKADCLCVNCLRVRTLKRENRELDQVEMLFLMAPIPGVKRVCRCRLCTHIKDMVYKANSLIKIDGQVKQAGLNPS